MANIQRKKRANGWAYEVRWRDHGKDRQITCKTESAALREKVRIEDLLAAGRSTATLVERRTVAEVFKACMAAGEGHLKPRTLEGQRSIYRNHIGPALGRRRITSLRAQDVEKWVASLSKKLGHGSVRNAYVVLNKLCKYAIRHDWLAVNPCTGVALPQDHNAVEDKRQFLTPAQVEALAVAMSERREHYGLVVRMAAYTGLRSGELAGLRIRDVNLFRNTVEVRRTVRRAKGGGWVAASPKSRRSIREVPLLPRLAAELRAYLEQHPNRLDPDSALWPGSRKKFQSSEIDWNIPFDINNLIKSHFRKTVRAGVGSAGISTATRWHDLRHTYASIMAAAPGITIYEVCNWMGHADISTTQKTYIHLFRTDYTDKMASVGAFLDGAGQGLGHVAPVTALRSAVGGS
ncbi:tyrosine-type recombinase/integrase [Streptomyces sp. HUCO-GS316]|uniref:tyrosine-type recombinase/integrase n=1 Tax=Streptomyces sp. HUCO-GS316 TaxID=2692198 RepID=UPI00136B7839|nr:site-specific integrase [Streptomyces sp. HUCO-GS316]MXM65530.1 tyrosine-type recombinase/integrase [Streptomyces sp. HUCO-GS316]